MSSVVHVDFASSAPREAGRKTTSSSSAPQLSRQPGTVSGQRAVAEYVPPAALQPPVIREESANPEPVNSSQREVVVQLPLNDSGVDSAVHAAPPDDAPPEVPPLDDPPDDAPLDDDPPPVEPVEPQATERLAIVSKENANEDDMVGFLARRGTIPARPSTDRAPSRSFALADMAPRPIVQSAVGQTPW